MQAKSAVLKQLDVRSFYACACVSLKKLPVLIFSEFLLCMNKAEQGQRHHYMVSKAPIALEQMHESPQFSVCKLSLLCHLAAASPPHECLQAVARADWMKGNLLFTRKSSTLAITLKVSFGRQFLLDVNPFSLS